MSTDADSPPCDVREPVLAAMLSEALALTEEVAAADADRAARLIPDPVDSAGRLRLTARLARIGAWASALASPEPDHQAFARRALAGAAATPALDDSAIASEERLAPLRARVDRLAERALRLDRLMAGLDDRADPQPARSAASQSTPSTALEATPASDQPATAGAVVLRFPERVG